MTYPAANSGVSIRNLIIFIAASGGQFNPERLKEDTITFRVQAV